MSIIQTVIQYDVIASRPAAGNEGYLFASSDESPPTLYRDNGSTWDDIADLGGGGGGSSLDYILIEDQKTSGTDGGTFTSGAWRTRDLNTEVADAGNHASVGSNQITLAAGTYRCRASAPVYMVGGHMIRLRDITNSATLISGVSSYSPGTGDPPVVRAELQGRFTIAGSTTIELQHQCVSTKATNGFGGATGFTVPHETYSFVELIKE